MRGLDKKGYISLLTVLVCVPHAWICLLSLVQSMRFCISGSEVCGEHVLGLIWALPFVILGTLVVLKIKNNAKNWKLFAAIFLIYNFVSVFVFEVIIFSDVWEYLEFKFRTFAVWIKFTFVYKSVLFLYKDFLNPILLFASLFLLIRTIKFSNEG